MKHVTTQGIVLNRVEYGEASRIISFLTSDQGKVSVLARGVRKQKSKLAGGIELFSISEITFIVGRGEVYTLISARLVKYYSQIVKNIDRTSTGYDFIKILNKATEDHPEPAYFELLKNAFEALDDSVIDLGLIQIWFRAQLLRLGGHTPNLQTDEHGKKLAVAGNYSFNFETMNFYKNGAGGNSFSVNKIKFLRLIFSGHRPKTLQKVQGVEKLASGCQPLVESMLQTYVRV